MRPATGLAEEPAPLTGWLEGLADSVQALADRDPAAAEVAARRALVARPGGDPGARAELALALALRDGGRFAEAADQLARIAPRLGARVAWQARFELAQALLRSGRAGRAASILADVAAKAPGALARRARWREADALFDAGAARPSLKAYEALLAAEPRAQGAPAARLAMAGALRALGQYARAVAAYRALWIQEPGDPAGQAAGALLSSWREAGGPVPEAGVEERLARAARCLELALPRQALATLESLDASSPPPEPASRSALMRALALLQTGRRDEAEALARKLGTNHAASAGTLAGAELVLARVAARTPGRLIEAATRYRRIGARAAAEIPGIPPAQARGLPAEATFLAAWLHLDAGDLPGAAELLHEYAKGHPGSRRAEDASWFEAWAYHRMGQRARALAAMTRLARGALAPAALYWQARLTSGPEQQGALYRQVLRQAPPGSWYALLAAGRLAARGERPSALALAPPTAAPESAPSLGAAAEPLARAAELVGAGMVAEGIAELRELAGARPSVQAAEAVAELAQAAGDAELPFRMARDRLPHTRRALRWLYPVAFRDLVGRSALSAGVDRYLYLAVMRRESAFSPQARSGAGARGLVQLIPPTAERLAVVHGLPAGQALELDQPAVSIPLGAAYLGLLTERFGDPAAVLAAYNAGPPAAAGWLAGRDGAPLDEWVEGISFRETRHYVRNVMADWATYRAVWEGAPLAIDGARPVPAPREGVAF